MGTTIYIYSSDGNNHIYMYSADGNYHLYINMACLFVCLFGSNCFQFCKKFKFLKIREFIFKNPQNFYLFFVLKCKQKEHVHNLKRRWARSALKA